MALESVRFAGVPELEACAVDDSAHLLPGSSGPAVALVQQVLLDLGENLGAGGADGVYGAATAAAVTAYKAARGLLNASGAADPVVGKLTIASLDAEVTVLDATLPESGEPEQGAVVDLGGVPEPAVNALLGRLGAGRAVEVDADGMTQVLLGLAGDPSASGLLVEAAQSSASLLGPDAEAARFALVGGLPQLAAVGGLTSYADVVADITTALAQLTAMPSGAGAVPGLLAQAGPPSTPARDLTKIQALAIAVAAHQAGVIVMNPAPVVDAGGAVLAPSPTATVSIGSSIGLVTFRKVDFADKTRPPGGSMPYAPVTTPLLALDVRHLVGLIRLATHLNAVAGVTEIHHAGISGSNDPRGDCHRQGRACDFVGVRGVAADTPYTLTVLNDWAKRTVPNLAQPGRPRLPDWPTGSRTLEYRLATLPNADGFARAFFLDLYTFVASEFQDRTAGPGQTGPDSTIGTASRIMTPDHPTSAPGTKHGREAHTGHVHFQIGPTGTQAP